MSLAKKYTKDFYAFRTYSKTTYENGYPIVPCSATTKRAIEKEWPLLAEIDNPLMQERTKSYLKERNNKRNSQNVGIVCGRVVAAIDVDVHDEELTAALKDVVLEEFPEAQFRIGSKGFLAVFRIETSDGLPFKVRNSQVYLDKNKQKAQVEMITHGRQFVAFGINSSTKRPYTWDSNKSPFNTPLADQPVLTTEWAEWFIDRFETLCEEKGFKITKQKSNRRSVQEILHDDPMMQKFQDTEPLEGLTLDIVRQCFEIDEMRRIYIDGDREDWRNLLMAAKHQFGDEAEELIRELSMQSDLYNEDDFNSDWKSFSGEGEEHAGGTITMRTILSHAKKLGYVKQDAKGETVYEECAESVIDAVVDLVGGKYARALINESAIESLSEHTVSKNSKIHLLTPQRELENPLPAHTYTMFTKAAKQEPHNAEMLGVMAEAIERSVIEAGDSRRDPQKAAADFISKLKAKIVEAVTVWTQWNHSVANGLTRKLDPFETRTAIVNLKGTTTLVEPFLLDIAEVESPPPTKVIKECYDEYITHNPYFEEITRWLANCAFATDRRNAYLWLRASAGWGKGFLFKGVYGYFNLIGHTSTKELKKAVEQEPSGLKTSDVLGKLALVISEFSSAPAAIKELENEITFSAKNKLRETIPLYAKIGTSKDGVPALAGEAGVETQFEDRFTHIHITKKTRMEDLEYYQKHGKNVYREAIRVAARRFLKEEIDTLKALGPGKSAARADKVLLDFHKKYKITNTYGTMSGQLSIYADELADIIRDSLQQRGNAPPRDMKLDDQLGLSVHKFETANQTYGRLTYHKKVIEAYFHFVLNNSAEVVKVMRSSDEVEEILFEKLGAEYKINDRGVKTYADKRKDKHRIDYRGIFFPIEIKDNNLDLSEEDNVVQFPSKEETDEPKTKKANPL